MKRIATKLLFAATDPMVKLARAIGMFDSKRIGATAIEYGLIAAGISLAIITVVQGLSESGFWCRAFGVSCSVH